MKGTDAPVVQAAGIGVLERVLWEMRLSKSLIVLLLILGLLYASANINTWVGPVTFSDNQVQALQFALTLLGIFLGAHYELQRFERRLREERRKEVRQQRLKLLDHIESWLKDTNSAYEDIDVLRELSEKDEQDGALLISPDKIQSTKEDILRLEGRGLPAVSKAMEIDDEELISRVVAVWGRLGRTKELMLSSQKLPGSGATVDVTRAIRAIDKVRVRELEHD